MLRAAGASFGTMDRSRRAGHYPEVAPCHKDQVRQAKADFPLVLLCPDKSMAPVLAITDMVARARRDDSLL